MRVDRGSTRTAGRRLRRSCRWLLLISRGHSCTHPAPVSPVSDLKSPGPLLTAVPPCVLSAQPQHRIMLPSILWSIPLSPRALDGPMLALLLPRRAAKAPRGSEQGSQHMAHTSLATDHSRVRGLPLSGIGMPCSRGLPRSGEALSADSTLTPSGNRSPPCMAMRFLTKSPAASACTITVDGRRLADAYPSHARPRRPTPIGSVFAIAIFARITCCDCAV